MKTSTTFGLALMLVGLAWWASDYMAQAMDESTTTTASTSDATAAGWVDNIMAVTIRALGLWRAPAKYADTIAAAEAQYGIPSRMLERLLWQESRYREDIITGQTRSRVGAVGIAQFMPSTARQLGIDPLNPDQAINGAARYLAGLYQRFGTWAQALAAYNWGMGNVARSGLDAAPTETRNYYSQILADTNAATGAAWA